MSTHPVFVYPGARYSMLRLFTSLLASVLFLVGSFASPVTETITFSNFGSNTLTFNININGIEYYANDQSVTSVESMFTYQRDIEDTVEVILKEYSNNPGQYTITTSYGKLMYDSTSPNFYVVNQCPVLSAACIMDVNVIGTIPEGVTLNFYVNGNLEIGDFNLDGAVFPYQNGDVIYVEINGTYADQFELNFTTEAVDMPTPSPIQWFPQGLATQMIIPTVYFASPLDGQEQYAGSIATISLISYPSAGTFNVYLFYAIAGDPDQAISTTTILSNTETPQGISIPYNPLKVGTYWLAVSPSGTNYFGTNQIQLNVAIPESITFGSPTSDLTYSAGSAVPVQLTVAPADFSGNFTVQLTCGSSSSTSSIASNTDVSQDFIIPAAFYGYNCEFSIVGSIPAVNTPLITVTLPVTFALPLSLATFPANSQFEILVQTAAIIPGVIYSVYQTCLGKEQFDTLYPLITFNATFNGSAPPNYIGTCYLTSYASGLYQGLPPVYIQIVEGTIEISQPADGTQIPAGTDAQLMITATPGVSAFTVQLQCSPEMTTTAIIQANTEDPQPFAVPDGFYGISCAFSVIDYPNYYSQPSPSTVIITQNVVFTEPSPTGVYYVNTPFIVMLSADVILSDNLVTVTQTCGDPDNPLITNYPNVIIGTVFEAKAPVDFTGTCTFTSSSTAIYNAASPSVVLTIQKGLLKLIITPESRIQANTNAGVKIEATPSGGAFNVELNCGGSSQETIGGYMANFGEFQDFLVPKLFYGMNCVFSIVNYAAIYAASNTITVTISQPVRFLRPSSSRTYYVNSVIGVAPRSNLPIPSNPITVVQECASNRTEYTNVIVFEDIAVIPPYNYLGPCTFSSLQSGVFDAASPNVIIDIVKGVIAIVNPTEDEKIAAGSVTGIKITATSGIEQVLVQLSCGTTMQTTPVPIPVNTDVPQPFAVPKTFYGDDCVFSVVDSPIVFNPPESIPVVITQQLRFVYPESGSRILRLNPLPILVEPGFTSLKEPIELLFECVTPSGTSVAVIGGVESTVPYIFDYTAEYFGACFLQTATSEAYFIDVKVEFRIQNDLEFLVRPNYLVNGQDFLIEFERIGPEVEAYNTVDLEISCSGSMVEEVPGLSLDQPIILNVFVRGLVGSNGPLQCVIRTLPSALYPEISARLPLYVPLTAEEVEEALARISIAPGTEIIAA